MTGVMGLVLLAWTAGQPASGWTDPAPHRAHTVTVEPGVQLEVLDWGETGYQPKTDEERATIDRFMSRGRIVFGRWTTKLRRHVPDARIVNYPLAGHYVFITREADVLREIHTFVAAIGERKP